MKSKSILDNFFASITKQKDTKGTVIYGEEELVSADQEFHSAYRNTLEEVKAFDSKRTANSMLNNRPDVKRKQLMHQPESFFSGFSHLSWLHEDSS
jgi:hypothetical protein